MRRPFLIIFIILLIVSFIYTNTNAINTDYGNEDIEIIGIVKYKKEKGIDIYFIKEWDWTHRQEVVKRYLKILISKYRNININ